MKGPLINKCQNRIVLISCFVISSYLLISCNKTQELKADHPALMQRFADTLVYNTVKHGLKKGFEHFDEQYAIIKDPGIGDQIAYYRAKQNAYYETVHWDYSKMDPAISLAYPDSILQLIEKNDAQKLYKREYIEANFAKGDIIYYTMHKYGPALSYYFKGKTLTNELTSDCDRAGFTKRFAIIDYEEGKFRQAASLFMQEYHQRTSCAFDFDNFAATQHALDNAGDSYNAAGMSDSAIYCFTKNLVYVDKYAHLFPLRKRYIMDIHGVANGFLGLSYYNKGENKKAEEHFKESLRLDTRGGNEGKNAQSVQLQLARLYLTTGRIKQADSMAREIKQSLDTLPNEGAALELGKLKVEYYNFLNEPKKAQTYLDAYLQLKHKADLVKRDVIETDVENYFSTVQKNYDQAILKKEKELRSLQQLLFIGFTILILFITFQFWNSSRIEKKNNFDLTEVNRQTNELNLSLQNTLSVLKQSQEENVRVLQIVAHDLRDPIGSIFAISSLMLKSPDHSEKDRTMLELIKTSGKNCLELASDLLKINIKPGEIKKGTINLAEMLNFCVAQLKSKADRKKQILALKTRPCNVNGSPEKLWRVISNLISNAIKFSPDGETINISLEEGGKGAIVTVKDNGIGIPAELKDKIFNMVGGSMRHGTAGEQPFGMGLSISKQIVDAHGGRLWFESVPGNGTTFYVELVAES